MCFKGMLSRSVEAARDRVTVEKSVSKYGAKMAIIVTFLRLEASDQI